MAERRMRLKRGKIGDTGIPVTYAPPALSFPESLSQEPSAFDEDMVDRIAEAVGCAFLDDDAEGVVRHAIKLTMATTAMQQVLNPPLAHAPESIAPSLAEVRTIDVTIRRVTNRFNMNPVSITVAGRGDPVQLLRAAADTFHSDITRIITYD